MNEIEYLAYLLKQIQACIEQLKKEEEDITKKLREITPAPEEIR